MELVPMSTAATFKVPAPGFDPVRVAAGIDHARHRAVERFDFGGDDLSDRVVAMATRDTRRVIGVVSMKALDAEARPGHPSLRTMGRAFGDQFVALDPVPLVGVLQALTEIRIVAGTRLDQGDVPSRLDPGHPADRQRTAQPVAGWERACRRRGLAEPGSQPAIPDGIAPSAPRMRGAVAPVGQLSPA